LIGSGVCPMGREGAGAALLACALGRGDGEQAASPARTIGKTALVNRMSRMTPCRAGSFCG
jgi:hypothetical protein